MNCSPWSAECKGISLKTLAQWTMEREYDKTLDLSRGQGTGMQSFERENGKRWSNVISLRWEYLQLSRNFSCLWPLCPCHRLRAPECTDELEGAMPATACIKLCFWHADGSKAQVFWACSYSSPSCKACSCGAFTSSSMLVWVSASQPSLLKPQGPWCIFHTGFPMCEILKQMVLLSMTSSNPQFFL